MSYQERKTIVSLISGAFVVAAYCLHTFGRYQAGAAGANDLKFWAGAILTFVGIGIAVSIVIQIIFHILMSITIAVKKKIRDEQCDDKAIEKSIDAEMVEDEMDKLIELKSMRVGFFLAGIGFIAGLVSLVLGYSAAVMLNILFLSFSGGSLLEGAAQLYFYRRGVTHA
jgi:hypothetical protein